MGDAVMQTGDRNAVDQVPGIDQFLVCSAATGMRHLHCRKGDACSATGKFFDPPRIRLRFRAGEEDPSCSVCRQPETGHSGQFAGNSYKYVVFFGDSCTWELAVGISARTGIEGFQSIIPWWQ